MKWQDIRSVEDVCAAFPELVEDLRDEISIAVDAGSAVGACQTMLDYYRRGSMCDWLRGKPPEPGEETDEKADKYAAGWFNKKDFWMELERDEEGHLRWDTVPDEVGGQFFCNLNRHFMFARLYRAYRKTGNRRYVRALDRHMRDWFTFAASRGELDYGKRMQVALRMPIWARIFYGTLGDPEVSDAVHLLMLAHIPTQARHLIVNPLQNNGFTMTIHGLLTTAICWEEFNEAERWEKIGVARLNSALDNLVYPDGVATELTAGYHGLTRSKINSSASLLWRAGRTTPDRCNERIERMYAYRPQVIRPDGAGPLNNDSDRNSYVDESLSAAERFGRPEWAYMATGGEKGEKPADPPSRAFPWAGQLVTRNGWTPDSHWAFFDIGPWGTGHQHNDKLHLSVHAHGRDLLVDSGRFWYEGGPVREYALSGAGHNVAMLDGCGQLPGRKRAEAPVGLISRRKDFDFAAGRFDRGFGPVSAARSTQLVVRGSHLRSLVYLRDHCWLVVDRVMSQEAERWSALWHFHPDCSVKTDGTRVWTADEEKGNLEVRPLLDPERWHISLEKGREEPTVQGWYSEESYSTWHKNVCAVFESPFERAETSVWLLTPGKGEIPHIEAFVTESSPGGVRLRLTGPEDWKRDVAVKTGNDGPLDLGGGRLLKGYCAVGDPAGEVAAACGRVVTETGETVTEDPVQDDVLLEHATDELCVEPDCSEDGAEQLMRMRIHNPLPEGNVKFRPEIDVTENVKIVDAPRACELSPSRERVLDIRVVPESDGGRPRGNLKIDIQGPSGNAINRTFELPVRPVLSVVDRPGGTNPEGLFEDETVRKLAVHAEGKEHGSIRIAATEEGLLFAAELHDVRCGKNEQPSGEAPQLEIFADSIGGRHPRQLVINPTGEEWGPSINVFGQETARPDIDVVVTPLEGKVRISSHVTFAEFGIDAGDDAFLFETAMFGDAGGEGTDYVTLFGSSHPYLDNRHYAVIHKS